MTRALENLKNVNFNWLLLTKLDNVWDKSTEELRLMALKIDSKYEGKLAYASKYEMRNLVYFHQTTRKSQNWDFDGILLSKVKNVWICRYVSWQRIMQNLKRNWFTSSKSALEIWWFSTRSLENLRNLHFYGLLLNKVYNVWTKKVQRSCAW